VTEATPIRISWSQLRTHEECRQKSHLIRSGNTSPVKDLRTYYHGMVVDRAMRDWLGDPDRQPNQMAARVDELVDSVAVEAKETGDGVVRWRSENDRATLRRFCVTLLHKLEPILRQLVLPHRFDNALRFRQEVTLPIHGEKTTVILSGELDIATHTPQGLEIWDLKGTADESYWRKVLGQLVFYDLAMYALHGKPSVRVGLIQPMCSQPWIDFVLTNDQRTAMYARIVRMVEQITDRDFACKTTTGGCNWCEVKYACPRFNPAPTVFSSGLRAAAQKVEAVHG
jgi:hypothetical protein